MRKDDANDMSDQPRLQQALGPENTRIYGYGAARGELSVPNDDIVDPINSSDEWIRQRTGIERRRRARPETTALDLAERAAAEAIEASGVAAADIGAVIVATVSNMMQTPSLAARLANAIGASAAPAAFDISAACAGFCYGVAQADAIVRSGIAEHVLVVGVEKLSDIVDPTDRTISFLLGDGAGACVIGPAEEPGISRSILGSDGSRWHAISMNATLQEFRRGEVPWPTLRQDGPSVFRWAVWDMAKVARATLDAAGIAAADLAAFIPHQANMRIIDEFAKQLAVPEGVVIARDIAENGNTSAASIPIATYDLLHEHPEISGGYALEIGFGAGLVYGAQVVRLP